MAQPQHQIQMPTPTPAFSPPPQMSPPLPPPPQTNYPAAAAAAINHPSKRQKMSPGPGQSPQPASPSAYIPTASFTHSPVAATPTPPASGANAASPPPFAGQNQSQNHHPQYPTTLAPQPRPNMATSPSPLPPYLNGSTSAAPNGTHPGGTMQITGLTMPSPRMPGTPPVASPALPGPPPQPVAAAPLTPLPATSSYATTAATLAPMPTTPAPPGAMGPPSKPADRPAKDVQYEWDDTLAGTGIDMREEEQYLASFYAGTTRSEARTGFPANAPGNSSSFYGAGMMNQPAFSTSMDQTQFQVEIAKAKWTDSASKLASVRGYEVRNPFTNIAVVHRRAHQITKDHGISLILDVKNNQGMGKMKTDTEFPQPSLDVETRIVEPGGQVVVSSSKSFLPNDSFLAEQIGLLSIATKHRIRQLLEDADRVATHRQKSSHGEIPAEWADVAVPLQTIDASLLNQATPSPGLGDESAVSPRTNPLKRPLSTANPPTPRSGGVTPSLGPGISLTAAMRETSRTERDAEELRLRKRQKRAEEEERRKKGGAAGDSSAAPSRAGSVAPGTPGGPGSIAPDGDASASAAPTPQQTRQPTKKELKAKATLAARTSEAQATANSNITMNLMFKKKKGKQYSWLNNAGSGASTPQRGVLGGGLGGGGALTPGGGAATPAARAPEVVALTIEGRYRLGEFRESGEKGKNIQLRDWVAVLEQDGLEVPVLQRAYDKLDSSR